MTETESTTLFDIMGTLNWVHLLAGVSLIGIAFTAVLGMAAVSEFNDLTALIQRTCQ